MNLEGLQLEMFDAFIMNTPQIEDRSIYPQAHVQHITQLTELD